MTDDAAPPTASKSGPAPWLFALAVFVSASLIFVVQPMLARMILPKLGGSSMVWNTCLVFFQAALLAGYFYADLLQRIASLHRQMLIHIAVLAAGALALPLRISGLLGDPWVSAPALWLVFSLALSIGAPGSVPLLDFKQDWWVGVRDFEARFGKPLNLEAMQALPVQMVVGKADIETWEITHRADGKYFMAGANEAGRTRPERIRTLRNSFEAAGVRVQLDELDNVPHNGLACCGKVQDFFAATLTGLRAVAGQPAR